MAKLTTKRRKALPKDDFALPGKRAYPVDTKARAANAKARSTQAVKAGRMSASTKAKIDAKANKTLAGKGTPNGKKAPKGGKLTDRFESAIAGASGRAKKKRTK